MEFKFPKKEKITYNEEISVLFREGRTISNTILKISYKESPDSSRVAVTVPKKIFKRAVVRNLLKRRIREAWRLNRSILEDKGYNILFIYTSKEIKAYQDIESALKNGLSKINKTNKTDTGSASDTIG